MVFLKPGYLLISGFLPRFAGRWYLGCWTTCSTRLRWNCHIWMAQVDEISRQWDTCLRRECYSLDHWWIPTGWIPANCSSWAYCDLAIEWSCMCYWTRSLDLMLLKMSHTRVILTFRIVQPLHCLVVCVCVLFHCSSVPLLYTFASLLLDACLVVLAISGLIVGASTARSQIAEVADDSWWFSFDFGMM